MFSNTEDDVNQRLLENKVNATEDDVNQSLLENKVNALERFYDHFIKEINGNPIPFGKWEKVSIFLEILGASAGIYSWPPAWQYGKDKPLWLAYSLTITNPISNVLFLGNATDQLFDSIARELSAPKHLKDIINILEKKDLVLKYIKMTSGSIICAISFGIVTYLFSLPDCDSTLCISTIVAHSLLANTILHAISWNLILTPRFWYYRLPYLPFEMAYDGLRKACLIKEKKLLQTITKKEEQIYQKYREIISGFFISSSEKIVSHFIKNRNQYHEKEKLIELQTEGGSISKFITTFTQATSLSQATQKSSSRNSVCGFMNRMLSNGGMGFLGASSMLMASAGWIFNPIYIGLMENLSLPVSIAIGILPSYSTAILCAFYGSAIANQIYQYFTTWEGNISEKFSLEARMYPVTFSLFLLVNLYLSAFAYGTAEQLINTVFEDKMWDEYRPYMQYSSIPVFQLLSFVPLLSLFNTFVRKSIAKFGKEGDEKLAMRLLLKSSILSQRLQQINGKALIDAIQRFSQEQQNAIGIKPNELKKDMDTLETLNKQKSTISNLLLKKKTYFKRSSGWNCPSNFWFDKKEKGRGKYQIISNINTDETPKSTLISAVSYSGLN